MVDKLEFIYNVVPYNLLPQEYPEQKNEEEYIFRLFISRVYEWIVDEGQLAIYAALKFWLTLNKYEFEVCTVRMMPSSLDLIEFAEMIQNKELQKAIQKNEYNCNYYQKLFKNK